MTEECQKCDSERKRLGAEFDRIVLEWYDEVRKERERADKAEEQLRDDQSAAKFAAWVSANSRPSVVLDELKSLICMRCGTPRPSILELSKGGKWCCYPPVD